MSLAEEGEWDISSPYIVTDLISFDFPAVQPRRASRRSYIPSTNPSTFYQYILPNLQSCNLQMQVEEHPAITEDEPLDFSWSSPEPSPSSHRDTYKPVSFESGSSSPNIFCISPIEATQVRKL